MCKQYRHVGAGFMHDAGRCSISEACRSAGKACGLATVCKGYRREVIELARGERIESAQLQSGRLQTLLTGIVAFCGSLPDGRRQIYSLAAPGDLLCTSPVAGLDCWAEALADTTICEVQLHGPRKSEVPLEPVVADAVLHAHDAHLSAAFRHIVLLGRLNAVERVQAFLIDMANRVGRRDGDALHLTLPLSREDIGDYLGLNAESVSRAIRQIKSSGDVQFVSPTRMRLCHAQLEEGCLRFYGSPLTALVSNNA